MTLLYPICLDLCTAECLVVGAGAVGARKAAGLVDAGAKVRLVAETVSDAAAVVARSECVTLYTEAYQAHHLDGVLLAFAATGSRTVNAAVVADARARRILVSSADAPGEGDFIVPALFRRGDLCIAISTGGASPMVAQRIKSTLDGQFSPDYGEFLELLATLRSYIKRRSDDPARRYAAYEALAISEGILLDVLHTEGREAASTAARSIADAALPAPSE